MSTNRVRFAAAAFVIGIVTAGQVFLGGAFASGWRKLRSSQPQTEKQSPRTGGSARATKDDAALRARAEKLHRSSLVVDTHNDVTSPLADQGFDLGTSGFDKDGKLTTHTDLKRMKEGGLSAEFFAVYVGKEYITKKPSEGGGAARRALDIIDVVLEQVRLHPESLEMTFTVADIR